MPVIKSAIKRNRQAIKKRVYNTNVKVAVHRKTKAVRDEIAAGSVKGEAGLIAAVSEIDRAVKKGVLHKSTAARRKSRLTLAYNSAAPAAYGTGKTTVKKAPAKKPATKKPTAKK
jgi:small subunit ribosomal protein S20